MRNLLGKHAGQFNLFACDEDKRPGEALHERKSLRTKVTIERDVRDPREMKRILEHLAMQVEYRLVEPGITV